MPLWDQQDYAVLNFERTRQGVLKNTLVSILCDPFEMFLGRILITLGAKLEPDVSMCFGLLRAILDISDQLGCGAISSEVIDDWRWPDIEWLIAKSIIERSLCASLIVRFKIGKISDQQWIC